MSGFVTSVLICVIVALAAMVGVLFWLAVSAHRRRTSDGAQEAAGEEELGPEQSQIWQMNFRNRW